MSFFSKFKKGVIFGGKLALRSSTNILLGRYDRVAFDIIAELSNKNKGVPFHEWKETARVLIRQHLKKDGAEFTDTGLEILLNVAFDAAKESQTTTKEKQ